MAILSKWFDPELAGHQEFQSGLARSAVWVLSVIYVGLGMNTGYFTVDFASFAGLYSIYLIAFSAVFVSIYYDRRLLRWRRYLTLVLDISATSLTIWFTRDSSSPFYLFYIWVFVSYGTRYGREYLVAASLGSLFAYITLLTILDQWSSNPFESFIILLLLLVLPMYQFSLVRQLRLAREKAERAAESKANFLATMTHELRTPLNGLLGMLELLKDTSLNEEQKEYSNAMTSSSQMLRALINDILDVSKIDADRVELDHQAIDLESVVSTVCRDLSNQAFDKGIELNFQVDPRIPATVFSDKLRLQQILYNLIGNAVKFTNEGFIVVKLELKSEPSGEKTETICIQIEDTGIGMTTEEMQHVFEQFWQADGNYSRSYGGTGLGTTIAYNLVKLMGGDLNVRAREGGGTIFTIDIPFEKKGFTRIINRISVPDTIQRVLMVNSSASSRETVLTHLLELGIETVIADGEDSLHHQLVNCEFDLVIICDCIMDSSLSKAAKYVRETCDELPIVYIGYMQHRLPIFETGCASHLMQPASLSDLASTIGECVNSDLIEETSPEIECAQFSGAKILVAEDDAISARLLETLLGREGIDVTIAQNGAQALDILQDQCFDLAFIDIRMPLVDGLEFTRRYRKLESEEQHMPIIALTANAAEEVKAACYEAGMDMYLSKPLDNEVLIRVLKGQLTSFYNNGAISLDRAV